MSIKSNIQAGSKYLDYLIDPSLQGVNRLFVLSFEYNTYRTSYIRTYDHIRKTLVG